MVQSTSAQRLSYAPACFDKHNFRSAYLALDDCLEFHGYRVGAGSGAYNCRPITGGTGYSLHSYKDADGFTFWNGYYIPDMALAVDINPSANPYGLHLVTDMPRAMVDDISAIRTNDGEQLWYWGGYFIPHHDAMHWQIACSRTSLLSGVDWSTVKNKAAPPPPPPPPAPEPEPVRTKKKMLIWHDKDQDKWFAEMPDGLVRITAENVWNLAVDNPGSITIINVGNAFFNKMHSGARAISFNDAPRMEV